jgi:CRP-like cAMP-binding protein
MVEKCVQTYNDDSKKHILTMLRKIEFLKTGISPLILNQLVYTTPCRQYDAGQLIFKPGDPMNTIQLIEDGMVETFIYFEGSKFVLDRLYSGSVLNYRNLFLDDEPTQVYAQCMRSSYIIELEEGHLSSVIESYVENMKNNNISMTDDPRKRLQKYQINVMKENRGYPLDYIVNIPATV